MKKWLLLLLVLLGSSLVLAGDDEDMERLQRIQELQTEIATLTAQAQAIESEIHKFVDSAKADGELSENEHVKLDDLVAKAEKINDELSAKIEELEELREGAAEDGEQIRSISELARLLNGAYSFIYVSASKLDPRFAYYLSSAHPVLLRNNHFPRFPVVEYSNNYYLLVPGVAVLTNEGGWPLGAPPPFLPAAFVEKYGIDLSNPLWTVDLAGAYSPFPVVAKVNGEIPEPPIMFFDRVDVEQDVKYINVTFQIAGQDVTIPVPWSITPKISYRIYVVSTPLISEGVFDPERSTYSYVKGTQNARNKVLGPFMDTFYRSPAYGR